MTECRGRRPESLRRRRSWMAGIRLPRSAFAPNMAGSAVATEPFEDAQAERMRSVALILRSALEVDSVEVGEGHARPNIDKRAALIVERIAPNPHLARSEILNVDATARRDVEPKTVRVVLRRFASHAEQPAISDCNDGLVRHEGDPLDVIANAGRVAEDCASRRSRAIRS